MSATECLADTETAGVEGSGYGGGRHRCRRDRFNRRRNNPFDITNEAVFNDYSSGVEFTDSEGNSSAHLESSVGSWGHRVSVSEEVDLESGELEAKVHSSGADGRQCRICYLKDEEGNDGDGDGDDDDDEEVLEDIGEAMDLGCDCKGDLGTAHQKCAATWFLIKGDLNCEICGAIAQNVSEMARNVAPVQIIHEDAEIQAIEESFTGPISEPESESSLNGRKFVNVLLGCMVLAFLISWLFHFKMAH